MVISKKSSVLCTPPDRYQNINIANPKVKSQFYSTLTQKMQPIFLTIFYPLSTCVYFLWGRSKFCLKFFLAKKTNLNFFLSKIPNSIASVPKGFIYYLQRRIETTNKIPIEVYLENAWSPSFSFSREFLYVGVSKLCEVT